jgi:uncharacterized membrane protein
MKRKMGFINNHKEQFTTGKNEDSDHVPDFFAENTTRNILRVAGRKKSNLIVRNAGHLMPFPPSVAYEKFSDFSRHAEWNPNIQSSTYVDSSRKTVRWTREALGFVVSWTTAVTIEDPNKALAWKSIEGVKTENRVIFQSVDEGKGTLMIMSTSYKVPEKVFNPSRKIIGKTGKQTRAPNHTAESEQIKTILERFEKVVVEELERDAMYFL